MKMGVVTLFQMRVLSLNSPLLVPLRACSLGVSYHTK
jgi:hypothetical protein